MCVFNIYSIRQIARRLDASLDQIQDIIHDMNIPHIGQLAYALLYDEDAVTRIESVLRAAEDAASEREASAWPSYAFASSLTSLAMA